MALPQRWHRAVFPAVSITDGERRGALTHGGNADGPPRWMEGCPSRGLRSARSGAVRPPNARGGRVHVADGEDPAERGGAPRCALGDLVRRSGLVRTSV